MRRQPSNLTGKASKFIESMWNYTYLYFEVV